MVPILFIAYELAVEQACQNSGLGEATPCGVINMIANTLGAIEIFALTPILAHEDLKDAYISLLILLVIQMVAIILICLVKQTKAPETKTINTSENPFELE